MSEITNVEAVQEESFEALLEQSIKTLNTGDKVLGIVTGIGTTEVQIDLGTKHAGYIPYDEVSADPSVKAEDILEHHMHSELCMMSAETAAILNDTKAKGGRIICVGTTSCRTLESLVNQDGSFEEKSKWTETFIYPGYEFKAMQGLITNFHLPESTLVMLVSAFAGRENVLRAYNQAVEEKYRFFSFGDAMLIL